MNALCTSGSARALSDLFEGQRTALYVPSREAVQATQLTAFIRYCEAVHGVRFADYAGFHCWSIAEAARFWTSLLRWSDLRCEGSASPAITDQSCEHARFFPNLRLNYVENLLLSRGAPGSQNALTAVHWDGTTQRWSFAELREQVGALSAGFQALGLLPGQHVALLAHNSAASLIAALAAAALGCTIATVAPDLGAEAVLVRLAQIAPVLLLTDQCAAAAGITEQRRARLIELVRALHSLRAVVMLDGPEAPPPRLDRPAFSAQALIAQHRQQALSSWPALPFNHPLFILFTSGTTGLPKCLLHGAGGTLLEHLKEHRLHCDLSPGDKLFFHTSTGWMMWHWQLSALASGAELVLYDGAISSAASLWRIVADEAVTVFGTSPAYLQLCERSDARAIEQLNFAPLRAVLSTGSVLHPAEQDWVSRHVKNLPVQSISGGSDIIGCFVLGNPNLPAYEAECQCASLGMDVRAWATPEGPEFPEAPAAGPGLGDLVCMNPFPSRPLGMLGDPFGERLHAAYFARHPGCWTHGDLIELTEQGTALIHGRIDGVLNVHGVRIGPAEIYRILSRMLEICESMAVEQRAPEEIGGSRLVLLVVLREGYTLNEELTRRIKQQLQARGSAAHVPAMILAVDELPTTCSGKRSERSARDALNGLAVANLQALRNPHSLEPLRRFAQENQLPPEATATRSPRGLLDEAEMIRIWEQVLGVGGLTATDNFFDLGGTSLAALRLLARLQDHCRSELSLPLLYEAPTVGGLLEQLGRLRACCALPGDSLRLLREAPGGAAGAVPLFLIHGFGGSAMELRPLAQSLRVSGPVYGIEARGFRSAEVPLDRVEAMARSYVTDIRARQPHGPYRLIGYSFGGLVAYEMARVLDQAEESVELVLLDTTPHERFWPSGARWEFLPRQARRYLRRLRHSQAAGRQALTRELTRGISALAYRLRARAISHVSLHEDPAGLPPQVLRVRQAALAAFASYRPCPVNLPLTLLRSELMLSHMCDPRRIWRTLTPALTTIDVIGDHLSMIRPPHLAVLAERLSESLHGRQAGAFDAARTARG